MTQPIALSGNTPRLDLPFLFPGQAQKEFTVNEALARIDALLHPVVAGEADAVPQNPRAGECWVVGESATGLFSEHGGKLAYFDGSQWTFIDPVPGMVVFDRSTSLLRGFSDGWSSPAMVAAPSGGTTVDTEAREAIVAIMQALEGLSMLRNG